MGCNQTASTTVVETGVTVEEIPCKPEQIGRYINDIRADPKKYAALLEKELENFTDQYSIMIDKDVLYRTNQGKFVWENAIQFLKTTQSLPPLKKHDGLCHAATDHAIDLSHQKQLTHIGVDQSNPLIRMERYCKKGFGKTGQNIGTDFKLDNRNFAENTIIGLIIDDGVTDRGHRLSIFDKDFTYFGSASRVQGDKIITVINYLSENWELKQ